MNPAPKKPLFEAIILEKLTSLPMPWSSEDEGETWVCRNFFMTFQKNPRRVQDGFTNWKGKEVPRRMTCLYAMTVFYRLDKNPHGPSTHPILVVALETSPFMALPILGLFSGTSWSSRGNYADPLTAEVVKLHFFSIVEKQLGLTRRPQKIGKMNDAFGHPKTVLPEGLLR